MTPAAITAARQALGLTVEGLAAELGIHKTTLHRYIAGQLECPRTVALAIECLLRRVGLFASPMPIMHGNHGRFRNGQSKG